MRLHERTLPVQIATAELTRKLWDIQDELELSYTQMMVAVASVQADVARRVEGQEPALSADGYPQINAAVAVARQQFGLTDVEAMTALAEHQGRIARYLLRMERHPDDPDRKADEA